MAKSESVQKRLQKVRAPRVQMTYDVEIGDAIENKELPFVVGVVGDFGTDPEAEKKRLKDKKFVNVDAGNFDEVLGAVAPSVSFKVDNLLYHVRVGDHIGLLKSFDRLECHQFRIAGTCANAQQLPCRT